MGVTAALEYRYRYVIVSFTWSLSPWQEQSSTPRRIPQVVCANPVGCVCVRFPASGTHFLLFSCQVSRAGPLVAGVLYEQTGSRCYHSTGRENILEPLHCWAYASYLLGGMNNPPSQLMQNLDVVHMLFRLMHIECGILFRNYGPNFNLIQLKFITLAESDFNVQYCNFYMISNVNLSPKYHSYPNSTNALYSIQPSLLSKHSKDPSTFIMLYSYGGVVPRHIFLVLSHMLTHPHE